MTAPARFPDLPAVSPGGIVLEPFANGSGFDDWGEPEGREQRRYFIRRRENGAVTVAEIGPESNNDHGLKAES